MNRLILIACALGLAAGTALAQPAKLPVVGDNLPQNGAPDWPDNLLWLYDAPSFPDSAGKIVIHWFCAPRVATCTDDLARIITLKENNTRVYVIAYVNGSKRDAQKLDPIRGSEGVGRGTLAYGPGVAKLFKQLSIAGPASLVVGVDDKVALVSTGSSPAELDARDAKVNALASAIREYTASAEGPKTVKPNEKFTLSMKIQLAGWLRYSKKPGTRQEFTLMVPKDIKCDNTTLRGDQLKISDQTMSASVTCSGPRGSYEARAQINFGYETPAHATGIGTDGTTWKFSIQ
jgi:hypothetical protein